MPCYEIDIPIRMQDLGRDSEGSHGRAWFEHDDIVVCATAAVSDYSGTVLAARRLARHIVTMMARAPLFPGAGLPKANTTAERLQQQLGAALRALLGERRYLPDLPPRYLQTDILVQDEDGKPGRPAIARARIRAPRLWAYVPPDAHTAIVVDAEDPAWTTTELVRKGVHPNPAYIREVPELLVPSVVRQIEDGLDPFYVPLELVTNRRAS